MEYSFKCPAPCNHEIKVDAPNDDQAITKLMAAGKVHAEEKHPDMPPMSDQEIRDMLKVGMTKG